MKNIIPPVKGTIDYYPQDMAIRTWLYDQMRHVSESFGYQEFEGPMLESFDLYAAKSGEEIVEKQSYVFNDRSGERITLRPELTPTLARMVARRQPQLVFPLRWWSFGPFWRYERPQKGRSREFFQWNIDMIGDRSAEADAELVAIAATFFKQINVLPGEVKILVNNRALMDQKIGETGINPETRLSVYRLIDRRDKLTAENWEKMAVDIGLTTSQIDRLTRLIEDKTLWEQSEELHRLFNAIDAFGISEYVQFAPQIIRGLDYYTGTVFEAWDTAGDFRSLFGGGRYDNLVSDVGGQPVSAVGFAVGNMVLSLLVKKLNRLPDFSSRVDVLITIFDQDHILNSISLSNTIREAGLNVATYPKPAKLSKQFKYADRINARSVIVVGPDEVSSSQVTIKDLNSGDQITLPNSEVIERLRKLKQRISKYPPNLDI
jgi:histidyl-tRNA synthetase